MIIPIAAKIDTTWRTFFKIVNACERLSGPPYKGGIAYIIGLTDVLFEVTEVTCSHTIRCTQSNKKENSKNTIIKCKIYQINA